MTERITRLVLTRKPGEAIQIGDVRIVVVSVSESRVRIAIEAPASIPITRCELQQKEGECSVEP